jgi:hypothetical protein
VFAELAVRPTDDATAHAALQKYRTRTITTPPAALHSPYGTPPRSLRSLDRKVRGKALIKASRAFGPPVFARNLQVFAPFTDRTFFLRSG